MIRNIIFDLGNVLISFRPAEFFRKKNYPETIVSKIVTEIFESEEWLMLDNGDITTGEAIQSLSLKSSLKREEIALVFSFRTEIMFPLVENVKLLPVLKKHGFKLYYLSNFPLDIFEEIKNDYYFFRYFDGGIISSEVKMSKPDVRIYHCLLDRYSLIPWESIFIDDIEKNTSAATLAGIKSFPTSGSVNIAAELERFLNISLQ